MAFKVSKRGETYHYSGTVAGRRLRRTTGTADKGTAERIAAEAEAREWRRHLDGPEAQVTFAQASIAYRQAEKATRFLDRIEDYWKDTLIGDITEGAIKQSAFKLYPDAKAATRNRQVIVPTQAIINHAASMGWCGPIRVKRFKITTRIMEPATQEWVKAFAAHASPHLGALCLFMFGTGARIGEAVALTWGQVNLSERAVVLNQSKVGRERKSHLQAPVLAALANIPGNRNPDDPVFQYGKAENVKQVWDNVIVRAGIKRLTPHSCRHGFATTMLRAGYDVKTVATLGGWKDAATVLKYYAHARDDMTVTDVLFDANLSQRESKPTATTRKQRKIWQ